MVTNVKKRAGIFALSCALLITAAACVKSTAASKATIKLNKKTLTMEAGTKKTLKVKTTNISKIVSTKWSTDHADIAGVSSKGVVTANAEGGATIKCVVKYKKNAASKNKKKSLECKVTVLPKSGGSDENKTDENNTDETKSTKVNGTYQIHIQGDDWGCGVDKAILSLDQPVDSVSAKDFTVQETKQTTDWTTFATKEDTLDRKVTDAYLCDAEGRRAEEPSKYIAVELYISPNDGSPFLYDVVGNTNTWSDPYYLTIQLADGAALTSAGKTVSALTINTVPTAKATSADDFTIDSFKATDGTNYNYAFYKPAQDTKTLVVWLHGLGEGGTEKTDPSVVLLGAEAAQLSGEKFQSMMNGAYVLAPQCPTYWMDNDGKKGIYKDGSIQADGTSYYTESLHELIADTVKKTGAEKVLISGCSNGGYMSLVLALKYKDEYDGYVLICEALADSQITDQQLKGIKDLPLYFIYSNDDPVVDPKTCEQPTIERLKKLGATNLHVATTDQVLDTTGRFKKEDGSTYAYMGHWSWIYFFNNESVCDDHKEGAWQWMADLVKK